MNKFDTYLQSADKKQKWMIYASFILVLFLLLRQFVPPMLEKQENLQNSVDDLQQKIIANPAKKLKKQLAENRQALLQMKSDLQEQKQLLDYSFSRLYDIPNADFNEQKWALALDMMMRRSLKEGLVVKSLKNSSLDKQGSSLLKKKQNIFLTGEGSYANILVFLQYVENIDALVKIEKIKIENVAEAVAFEIDIDLYGVGL